MSNTINIDERLELLQQLRKDALRRIKKAPHGELKVYTSHGTPQFWARIDSKGHYLPKKERGRIAGFAQKEYDECLVANVEYEMSILKGFAAGDYLEPWMQALTEISPEKRDFVTVPILDDREYADEWLNQDFERLGFKEDAPMLFSRRGIRMRSKSELMIAVALEEKNIPFLYERSLYLKGQIELHPDFTILRARDRKEIIWEHFGLMDNPDYRENAFSKLRLYNKSGFFEGINLIATFETAQSPLDVETIRRKIKAYI